MQLESQQHSAPKRHGLPASHSTKLYPRMLLLLARKLWPGVRNSNAREPWRAPTVSFYLPMQCQLPSRLA
eukprot:scaffold34348_cov23-Tisochrysis_lutea.AAC.1